MTFTEAAAEVLRQAGKALHYKEITELAIERNLLSHVGKSPEVTMGARLAALLKKEDKTNPIVRIKPGVFGLREWDGKKGSKKKSAATDDTAADAAPADLTEAADGAEDDGMEVNALEVEAATRENSAAKSPAGLTGDDDDDAPRVVSGDDARRADLAASGAEMFDDEDDDDQPILSGPNSSPNAAGAAAGGPAGAAGDLGPDGGRRRRRRRRRGRGGAPGDERPSGPRLPGTDAGVMASAGPITPHAIVNVDADSQVDVGAPRDPLAPAPRPMVRDRQQIMAGGAPTGVDVPLHGLPEGDELAGRDLADAVAIILTSFDRSQGAVPVRSLVEALVRRGRLSGDPAAAATQLAASVRADILRRTSQHQRPRFRFSAGRVGLTDWALGGDLVRLEQEVIAAVERYRDAARRTMLRRLQELPGHAFLELALYGLERIGMTQLRTVRRAGSPGGEAHFCGVHKTGADEIRTAVVIRKDGREIGRERVSDLRGALHHYGPATAGWLITTGQVLSGAREEAGAQTAAPIALYDGLTFCRLLEDHDVGVVKTKYPVAIPDLDLFESRCAGSVRSRRARQATPPHPSASRCARSRDAPGCNGSSGGGREGCACRAAESRPGGASSEARDLADLDAGGAVAAPHRERRLRAGASHRRRTPGDDGDRGHGAGRRRRRRRRQARQEAAGQEARGGRRRWSSTAGFRRRCARPTTTTHVRSSFRPVAPTPRPSTCARCASAARSTPSCPAPR